MKGPAYQAILYSALGTSSGVLVKLGGHSGTLLVLLCVLAPYAYLLLLAHLSQTQVIVRAIAAASVLVCITGLIPYPVLYQRGGSMAEIIIFFAPTAQLAVLLVATFALRLTKPAEKPVRRRNSRTRRAAKQPPDAP